MDISFIKEKSPWEIAFHGFVKTLPFQTGVVPFALLYATLATNIGFPPWLVIFCSIVVFGGSSQLIFIDLLQKLSSPFSAVIGSNIVNARHLIYSAAVSPEFKKFSRPWRLLLAYLLTDQMYAVYQKDSLLFRELSIEKRTWFLLGSGLCTWFFWIFVSGLGISLGQAIPNSWNLDFAIPLMFLPMIFILSHTRADYFVALSSALFTVAFQFLPFGLGMFFSIILSSTIGYYLFAWKTK
jgi:predicted branched-subunit amino acid permease